MEQCTCNPDLYTVTPKWFLNKELGAIHARDDPGCIVFAQNTFDAQNISAITPIYF